MTYTYTSEAAQAYKGVSYQGSFSFAFNDAKRMLGNLSGKTALDFGSGAGRSVRFLRSLGAHKVIGVDHNQTMLDEARKDQPENTEFHLISDNRIPFDENFFDLAFCSFVFMEMDDLEKISQAMIEINRVLKPQTAFILIVTNPTVYGHDFVSFDMRDNPEELKSGDPTKVLIKADPPFEITDHFWTLDDYTNALEKAGFEIKEVTYPQPEETTGWLDEAVIAPHMVINCKSGL